MQDSKFKQLYAFVSLSVTIIWAAFCVWMTYRAVTDKAAVDILGTAGVNVLLGAMIAWNGNINQYFFRKAKPEESDIPPPA